MKVEMNGNNNINIGDPSSIKKPVYDVSGYTTNLAVMLVTLPFFLFNDLSMELNLKVKPLIILIEVLSFYASSWMAHGTW